MGVANTKTTIEESGLFIGQQQTEVHPQLLDVRWVARTDSYLIVVRGRWADRDRGWRWGAIVGHR